MRGHEATHRSDAVQRLLLVAVFAGFVFLATPAAPQGADAQVLRCPPPGYDACRPICEVGPTQPAATLTATIIGSGTVTASAKNPYKGAVDNTNKGTDECGTPTGSGPP